MKKILAISAMIFLCQAEAVLFDQYKDKVQNFNEDTDLIRGMILASKGALWEQRAYGAINFYGMETGNNDFGACSFMDQGKDPMSRLIILTHPSTGGAGLNAQGLGSIGDTFLDVKKQARIIAVMFKIAHDVREKISNNSAKQDYEQIIKNEPGSIFEDIKTIEDEKKKYDKRLIRLGKSSLQKKLYEETKFIRKVAWENKVFSKDLSNLIFLREKLTGVVSDEIVRNLTLSQIVCGSFLQGMESKIDPETQRRITQIKIGFQKELLEVNRRLIDAMELIARVISPEDRIGSQRLSFAQSLDHLKQNAKRIQQKGEALKEDGTEDNSLEFNAELALTLDFIKSFKDFEGKPEHDEQNRQFRNLVAAAENEINAMDKRNSRNINQIKKEMMVNILHGVLLKGDTEQTPENVVFEKVILETDATETEFLENIKLISIVFNTVNTISWNVNINILEDNIDNVKSLYKSLELFLGSDEKLVDLKKKIDEIDNIYGQLAEKGMKLSKKRKILFELRNKVREVSELCESTLIDSPTYVEHLLTSFLEKRISFSKKDVLKEGLNNLNRMIQLSSDRKRTLLQAEDMSRKIGNDYPEEYKALFRDFAQKYFQLTEDDFGKNNLLYELGKNVAEAVFLERLTSEINKDDDDIKWKKRPYFPGYVNDLICAYVWGAFPGDKLDILTDELSKILGYDKGGYRSILTEEVEKTLRLDLSVIPFYANQTPITNSRILWEDGSKFADCTETAFRQLFALILASTEDENGKLLTEKYCGRLRTATERIPDNNEDGRALRAFFAPNKDIRYLANDGSMGTRIEWAKICAKKKGVNYRDINHTLASGWCNIINLFCYLMRGYPDAIRQQHPGIDLYDPKWSDDYMDDSEQSEDSVDVSEQSEDSVDHSKQSEGGIDYGNETLARQVRAARRIEEIQQSHTFGNEDIEDIMNDLLGIRTDVKLVCSIDEELVRFGSTLLTCYIFKFCVCEYNGKFIDYYDDDFDDYNCVSIKSSAGHTNMERMQVTINDIPESLSNMDMALKIMAGLYFKGKDNDFSKEWTFSSIKLNFPMFKYFYNVHRVLVSPLISPYRREKIHSLQDYFIKYAFQNNGQYLEGLARFFCCCYNFDIPSLRFLPKPYGLAWYEMIVKNTKSTQDLMEIISCISNDQTVDRSVERRLIGEATDRLAVFLENCHSSREFRKGMLYIKDRNLTAKLIQQYVENKLKSDSKMDNEFRCLLSVLDRAIDKLDVDSFWKRESPLYQCVSKYLLACPTLFVRDDVMYRVDNEVIFPLSVPQEICDEVIEIKILLNSFLNDFSSEDLRKLLKLYKGDRFPADFVTDKFAVFIPLMFYDKEVEEILKSKTNLDFSELSEAAVDFILERLRGNFEIFANQLLDAYRKKGKKMPLKVACAVVKYLSLEDQLTVVDDFRGNILDSLELGKYIDPKIYSKFVEKNIDAIRNVDKSHLLDMMRFLPYILGNERFEHLLQDSIVLDYTEYGTDYEHLRGWYKYPFDPKVLARWAFQSYLKHDADFGEHDRHFIEYLDLDDQRVLFDRVKENGIDGVIKIIPFFNNDVTREFINSHIDRFLDEWILSHDDNFKILVPILLKHNPRCDVSIGMKRMSSYNLSLMIPKIMSQLEDDQLKSTFASQVFHRYKKSKDDTEKIGKEIINYLSPEEQKEILNTVAFLDARKMLHQAQESVVLAFIKENINKFKAVTNNDNVDLIPYLLSDAEIRKHLENTSILNLSIYKENLISIIPKLKNNEVKRDFINRVKSSYEKDNKRMPGDLVSALDELDKEISISESHA